jgi:hypothetical protein
VCTSCEWLLSGCVCSSKRYCHCHSNKPAWLLQASLAPLLTHVASANPGEKPRASLMRSSRCASWKLCAFWCHEGSVNVACALVTATATCGSPCHRARPYCLPQP